MAFDAKGPKKGTGSTAIRTATCSCARSGSGSRIGSGNRRGALAAIDSAFYVWYMHGG